MMTERCPLGTGLYWDNRDEIPEFCKQNCEPIWIKASQNLGDVDNLNPDCDHAIEYDDQSLQKLGGAVRRYAILNRCMHGCDEAFAEEWDFICPRG